jgi:thiamine biosynthesis lipoprotein
MLEVTVWEPDTTRALHALAAARAAVQKVDSLMSNYRPQSELSVVNRRAGTDTLTVISPETAEVLEAALRFARASGGALDVTVGPVVDVWGFYRPQGALPPAAALDSARALVGYERIEYAAAARTLRLPTRGMRLDFGAIAKGYAADRAVAAIRALGVERGKVDLGGNLRFAGAPPGAHGWRVGLRDPRSPDEMIAVVQMDSGSVATSGDYERFFVYHGVRYAHIIDPHTGWPARGVIGVSVLAPSGLVSDALSTALFVLGPDRGCVLAHAVGVDAFWILDGGAREGAIVITPGLRGNMELRLPSGMPRPRSC